MKREVTHINHMLYYHFQRFDFWVTAINLNFIRGIKRVRSYSNSIIDVKCNGTSKTKKVVFIMLGIHCFPVIQIQSSSCMAASPKWQSNPNINQISGDQLRLLKKDKQLIGH